MNRTRVSPQSLDAPLGRRPRRRLMSYAGTTLMFAGAASVLFALLAGLSEAAHAQVPARDRMRDRQSAQAAQQQASQQQAARSQQRSLYDRAFGACTEARGYTVR